MEQDQKHPDLSYRFLFLVLSALFVLTGLTVGVSTVNLGAWNTWIALIIAAAKASLVLLFFMHLKYEGMLLKLSFLTTISFLAILIGFIFFDISFR